MNCVYVGLGPKLCPYEFRIIPASHRTVTTVIMHIENAVFYPLKTKVNTRLLDTKHNNTSCGVLVVFKFIVSDVQTSSLCV